MRTATVILGALLLAWSAAPARAHDVKLAPEVQEALDRWAERLDRTLAEREVWTGDVRAAMSDLARIDTHALAQYAAFAVAPEAARAAEKRRRVLQSVLTAREYAKATSAPWELGYLLTSAEAEDHVDAIVRLAREDFTDDFLSCVIRLSTDDRPEVRVGAARLLTMWTSLRGYDDRAVNAVLNLLVDREPGVALATAVKLLDWDDLRVFHRLLDRMTDARVPRKGLPPYVRPGGERSVGEWIRDALRGQLSDPVLFGGAALRSEQTAKRLRRHRDLYAPSKVSPMPVVEDESIESWRKRVGPECGPRYDSRLWKPILDEALTLPTGGENVVVEKEEVTVTLRYERFKEVRFDGEPLLDKDLRLHLHFKTRKGDPVVDLSVGGCTSWGFRDRYPRFRGTLNADGEVTSGEAFEVMLMAVPSIHGGVRSRIRVLHRVK